MPQAAEMPLLISKNGSFVIEFNQRMNKKSVEKSIAIEPEIEFNTSWKSKTLFITPKEQLSEGILYYVSLSAEAKSLLGKHLSGPISLTYKLGEDPRILNVFPNKKIISPLENVIVIFSEPMVSENNVLKNQKPEFLAMDPVIAGEWMWRDSKVLVFTPDQGFPLSTRVTVKSNGPIQTYSASIIEEKINLEFETERLAYVKAEENKTKTSVTDPIFVQFNQQVSLKSLEKNIRLNNASGETVRDISIKLIDAPKNLYALRSSNPWIYDEEYTVSISNELMPVLGNLNLEGEIEEKIFTESFFTEETFQFSNQPEVIISNGEKISLSFKEEVVLDRLKRALSFSPVAEFKINKISARKVEVVFEDSQIRESMIMYVSQDINDDLRLHISKPLKYKIVKSNVLSLDVRDAKSHLCLTSNYPLSKKSFVSLDKNQWVLEEAKPEVCEQVSDYSYSFEKKYLPPLSDLNLKISAEDILGQKTEKLYLLKTKPLLYEHVKLESDQKYFYTVGHLISDLKFRYTTSNLTKLNIQACKITGETAVAIEGAAEDKWYNFNPDEDKCLKYKSYYSDVNSKWGSEQKHVLDLSEVFREDEIDFGLYYMDISSPNFFDSDGRELKISGILNYTNWNIFSKRGDSALVWITENNKPVANVGLYFYSGDGTLLDSGKTDIQGIFFSEDNKIKYEFIVAKKKSEEAILNIFNQAGYEPYRFSVPFNTEESLYLYQLFIEDPEKVSRTLNGVFIIKEKNNGVLTSPKLSGGTITLYDEGEQLLWRKFESIDEYGNLFFEINASHTLLDGRYQIGVCLGLHEGVCHGTYLWTTFNKGGQTENIETVSAPVPDKKHSSIILEQENELKSGNDLKITLKDLVPNVPTLITAERDKIFFKKIIIPDEDKETITLPVTDEMIPEVVFSLIQFSRDNTNYDVLKTSVHKENKKISYNPEQKLWKTSLGKNVDKVSQIYFQLDSDISSNDRLIFDSFYPRLGTSVITSSSESLNADASQNDYNLYTEQIPDFVSIPGKIYEADQINQNYSVYILAHDKEGNFGNFIIKKKIQESNLSSISINKPEFLREEDQMIFDIRVINKSETIQNMQFAASSNVLEFINDPNSLLGIPANQEKTFYLATKIMGVTKERMIDLNLELVKNSISETSENLEIPLIKRRTLSIPDYSLVEESPKGSGSVELSTEGAGLWQANIIISTSPLSYVLENIKNLLQKESLSFEESVFQRIVEINYSSLMKESWTQNEILKDFISKKNSTENLLYYLETRQKNDGGWSVYPEQNESDPLVSSWISKSISSLEQLGFDIPVKMKKNAKEYLKSELDRKVNLRIKDKKQITDLSEKEILVEMQLLNALSSLNPSGVNYANNWYSVSDKLSDASLSLLLLTLEDYRDAGVTGVNYKIEEIIQTLKERQRSLQNQIWIAGDAKEDFITDFAATSWYLEALVRQASVRNDIPAIITWLTRNKYQQKYQSPKDQFSFLQAMASYLRIYQEQIVTARMTVHTGDEEKIFEITPGQKFQSFYVKNIFTTRDQYPDLKIVQFSTDKEQPVFVETNWSRSDKKTKSVNNGLSIYQYFDQKEFRKGEKMKGFISIIAPKNISNLIVTHPIISGARDIQIEHSGDWQTKTFGTDEKWYLFPELNEGETIIPFEWNLTHAGIFNTPQIQAYSIDQPKTLSTSNTVTLEVRSR